MKGWRTDFMRKLIGYLLSIAVALAVVIDSYIVFFNGHRNSSEASEPSATTSTTSTTSSKQSGGQYRNGTYTGKSVQTQWGIVQVRAVIQNGKLTKVNVLKYPDSENRSRQINSRALPVYKAESIKAQSANIQHVSGATETYNGFKGSLQDALNQAQKDSPQKESSR